VINKYRFRLNVAVLNGNKYSQSTRINGKIEAGNSYPERVLTKNSEGESEYYHLQPVVQVFTIRIILYLRG
jgi:hypothetical protein